MHTVAMHIVISNLLVIAIFLASLNFTPLLTLNRIVLEHALYARCIQLDIGFAYSKSNEWNCETAVYRIIHYTF